MKKADLIISSILVLMVIGLLVGVKLMPQGHHDGHVHSETCDHDHDHAGHDHGHDAHDEHDHGHAHDEHDHDHGHADHDHDHGHDAHDDHEHDHDHDHGHDHGHAGEEIALNPGALKNIDLDSADGVLELAVGSFTRTHSIPAIVMEYQGRTTSKVAAPHAGIVTKIYREPGESVLPGEPLFDVTLDLPEMMTAQTEFLKLHETKEFLEGEIAEIDKNLNGLAPQRRRELDVRLKETEIEIRNSQNALRVLGLPDEMIAEMEEKHQMVTYVGTVKVPHVSHHGIVSEQNPGESDCSVVFETLYVHVGAKVEVGETLCDLCDLCELTVRGDAYAVNEELLLDALKNPETPVRVVFERTGKAPLENLRLRMVESKVDETNRTISCFADFKNVKLEEAKPAEKEGQADGKRYVHWLYKPGQRGVMEIAYETVPDVFVVPAGAVAKDVNETFVFELEEELENGEKVWHRHPVHLLFRTSEQAVLANDGSVKPGIRIAARSASFLQDALNAQNGSGAKIDPHAGHNH